MASKKKRVKTQKQPTESNFYEAEVEETTPARKTPKTRKAREKKVKDKQIIVKVDVGINESPKTRGKGTRSKKNNVRLKDAKSNTKVVFNILFYYNIFFF